MHKGFILLNCDLGAGRIYRRSIKTNVNNC